MLIDTPQRASGNEASLEIIDRCREIILQGEVEHVSVIMIRPGLDNFQAVYGGKKGREISAIGCAHLLIDELKAGVKQDSAPVYANPKANRVFYNCVKMPLAYDFLPALLQAEMRRVREGLPGPLRVGWFWGSSPGSVLRTKPQEDVFYNLTRPMVELIGAVEDESVVSDGLNIGEDLDYCSFASIVRAYEAGEPVPKLVAPPKYAEWADVSAKELGQAPVTITLREAEHHEFRNSNLPEWLKLADWLEQRGERVVFVRDTAKAREPLPGYRICIPASEHVLLRAALYQSAKCNLFVSNGPAMLPLFMDCAWMMFNDLTEDRKDFNANTAFGWKRATGVEPGGQWPWAKPNQRIVWSFDRFEAMRDAWLTHMDSA